MLRNWVFVGALCASGFAALVNQVVWQRSLARYLGGVESQSAMLVVMVFMAGLSVGAWAMGRRAQQAARPMRWLGYVEILLALCNLGICGLLMLDLSVSIYAFHRLASGLGIPLRLIYGLSAFIFLFPPCFLMGATMPLASESGERQLRVASAGFIPLMFTLNTIGSVSGAIAGGWLLIPVLGFRSALLLAIATNAIVGFLFLAIDKQPLPAEDAETAPDKDDKSEKADEEDAKEAATSAPVPEASDAPAYIGRRYLLVLAFSLGAISLGYEMLLLRIFALMDKPLPHVFSTVIAAFLFSWSVGSYISSRNKSKNLFVPLLAMTAMFGLGLWISFKAPGIRAGTASANALKALYFIPSAISGYLFGVLSRWQQGDWGEYVGQVTASNTIGSCIGLMGMTMFLFDGFSPWCNLLMLTVASLVLTFTALPPQYRVVPTVAAACLGLWAINASQHVEPFMPKVVKAYYGSSGVMGVNKQGHMFWDGLWHSRLTNGRWHIGTNNWRVAFLPSIFSKKLPQESLVVGLGTGITAGTLAKLPSMKRVDVYELNPKQKQLHIDHPKGTMHALTNKKIHITWQDARIGLALNPKKYDLIVTQPLHLRQVGASYINSREFFQLVRSRLKPGGVFCLYSNGNAEQAFVMRQTAASVFKYGESFANGYMLMLSKEKQIDSQTPARLKKRYKQKGIFWDEIRSYYRTSTPLRVQGYLDTPRLPWGDGRFMVTDNRPFMEYIGKVTRWIRAAYPRKYLPSPRGGYWKQPFDRRLALRYISHKRPEVQVPFDVTFGKYIRFLGYNIYYNSHRPTGYITVTSYFHVLEKLPRGWLSFAHLFGHRPRKFWNKGKIAVGKYYPVARWRKGEYIKSIRRFRLPRVKKSQRHFSFYMGLYRKRRGRMAPTVKKGYFPSYRSALKWLELRVTTDPKTGQKRLTALPKPQAPRARKPAPSRLVRPPIIRPKVVTPPTPLAPRVAPAARAKAAPASRPAVAKAPAPATKPAPTNKPAPGTRPTAPRPAAKPASQPSPRR